MRSKQSLRRHKTTRDSQRRALSCREDGGKPVISTLSEAAMRPDFIIAYKIMVYVKQNNLLEKLLNKDQTEEVRQFFETELSRPTYRVSAKVMRLLHEAFNKCWDKIMDDCEKIGFTNDVGLFLSEREKAKASFLDVMLFFPEFIPESWGGRHIVEISLPHPKSLISAKSQYDAEDILTPSQTGKTLENLSCRSLEQNLSCRTIGSTCTTEMTAKSVEPGWTESEMTRTHEADVRSKLTRSGKSTLKGHRRSRTYRRKLNGLEEGLQKRGHKSSSEMDSYEAPIEMPEISAGHRQHEKKAIASKKDANQKHKAEKSFKNNGNNDITEESKLHEKKGESEKKKKKKEPKMVERNDTEMEISVHDDEAEQRHKQRSKKNSHLRSARVEDEDMSSNAGNEGSESNRSQNSKIKKEGSESSRSQNRKKKNEASESNKRQKNKKD